MFFVQNVDIISVYAKILWRCILTAYIRVRGMLMLYKLVAFSSRLFIPSVDVLIVWNIREKTTVLCT